MGTEGAAPAPQGLGPRALTTWNSKGKKRSPGGRREGRKHTISCKIPPANIGPVGMERRAGSRDSTEGSFVLLALSPPVSPLLSTSPQKVGEPGPKRKTEAQKAKVVCHSQLVGDIVKATTQDIWLFVHGLPHHTKLPRHRTGEKHGF